MNILLTGATGFIGRALTKKLQEKVDYSITLLSSREIKGIKTILHNSYNFDENYLVSNGCETIDVLIHLGAFIPKSNLDANDINLCFSNISHSVNLYRAILPNLKKIIYISSIDVYNSFGIFSEKTVQNPVSLYGQSKLYCEQMTLFHAKKKNINSLILRVGHVFGPGEEVYKKVIPNTIRSILVDEPVKIFNGGQDKRNFIYIDDVVQSIINAISYDGEEQVINVTGNETVSIVDTIALLEKISGKKITREFVDTGLGCRDVIGDNSLLKKTLLSDFTSIETGLRKEYEYMSRI